MKAHVTAAQMFLVTLVPGAAIVVSSLFVREARLGSPVPPRAAPSVDVS